VEYIFAEKIFAGTFFFADREKPPQKSQKLEPTKLKCHTVGALLLLPEWNSSNYRMQGHFGPPHFHVSERFEERGIAQ